MAFPTQKQVIGQIGEDLSVKFLVSKGFDIVLRNYRKKFGEIDIICRKNNVLHFIEVKTVSRETLFDKTLDQYRPEDNIHAAKLKRFGRTIEFYILEKNYEGEWQFDIILVELCEKDKTSRIRMITDLVV